MDVEWIELHPDSRDFEITRQGISKNFKFVVTSNDFVENATLDYLPTTDLILINDDTVAQNEILAVFWQLIPIFFEFVVDDNFSVLLWMSSLRAKQINWNQWLVECTFDIPNDGGSNQGATDNPPDINSEKNTDQFTQISFNASLTQEKRQKAFIKQCSVRQDAPFAMGGGERLYCDGLKDKYRLIGQTDDSIEGYEANVRVFTFSITQYMKPNKLTYAYVRRLARLVGSINKDVFFGFAAYSVMCTGMDGSGTVYQAVPVTLDFEVKSNFSFVDELPERGTAPNIEYGQPNLMPLLDDVYFPPDENNIRKVDTTNQYTKIFEEEFMPSGVSNNGVVSPPTIVFHPGLAAGVHSGWSQIYYEYMKKQITGEIKPIRIPNRRYTFMPDDQVYENFTNFLL
jgi:hypothetical protein